jgi:pimeloyl-ACP methyl ester carboxylesterase
LNPIPSETLSVPGARLPYTLRGSGPLLLLIPGGEGGGSGYNAMADALAEHFTVATYDRRGAPGSTLDDPAQPVTLGMHAEDAHALLSVLTSETAYVFGSSGGALVGLDLILRWPEQVRLLVAHESPVEGLLAEFDAAQAEMAAALQQGGAQAALMKYFARSGMRYDDLEPGVVLPPPNPQEAALRGQALMRYTFPAVHAYRLDVAALAASPVKLVIAACSSGQDTPVHHCTEALAERLGKPVVTFPSHHAGYICYPRAFAARLEEVLQNG